MLKCSIAVCKGKVIGGVREKVHDPLLEDPTNWYLDKPVFYCQKHQEDVEELFAGKKIQHLVEEQLEYWDKELTT